MNLTDEGINLIKKFEGRRLKAYKDEAGVPTIGYGHTLGVSMGMTITDLQADQFLAEDLREAEAAVKRNVKVPLTNPQYSALVSWFFNFGENKATLASTLLRKLNKGDYDAVPGELVKWNKVRKNGVLTPSPGLTRRRVAEGSLWLSGTGLNPEAPREAPVAAERPSKLGSKTLAVNGIASSMGTAALAALPNLPLVVQLVLLAMIAVAGYTFYERWKSWNEGNR